MMASHSGRSQSGSRQLNGNNGSSFGASRAATDRTLNDDPLQPLRAMADRVGKEVEKFAERVDLWHTQGKDTHKARYQTTLRMVGKFKDIADSTVKELKKQGDAENKGELQKSVRRRIQHMAEEEVENAGHAKTIRSVVPSIEPTGIPPSSRVQELRQWQTEAATWELLRIIIQHYHPEPGTDVAAQKRTRLASVGGAYRYSPNSEIWDRFLLEDDQAKEKELILRWLEQTANNSESDIQSITDQLAEESGMDTESWTSGWLETRMKVKQAKRNGNLSELKSSDGLQKLVTKLDPDAPGRQKRALEKPDEYYERALWMVCYEMMRRGVPWKEISEWCKDRSEAWRGISIGAAYESHPDGGPNVAGPNVGYLFRRMCFYAAKGARTQYEGAVYGLLSGDLKEVEPVCRSWDDHLYTRYNALLLSRFDDYLIKNYPQKVPQTLSQKFVFQDAVANLGDWETSSSLVIDLLKQQKSTAGLALLPMTLIQGSLISRTMDELIYKVGVAIATLLADDRPTNLVLDPEWGSSWDEAKLPPKIPIDQRTITAEQHYQTLATDPHALRVLVHVFIVLRKGLGLFDMEQYQEWAAFDNVIVAYIEILRITKRIQLIPLYAAQLKGNRPRLCLARILPDIKNPEEQKNFISLMEQYHINPAEVISQNYQITSMRDFDKDASPYISKFEILEPTPEFEYLWPGRRIKQDFSGLDIDEKEEGLIDTLRWQIHLEKETYYTFHNLHSSLIYLLLHGRLGAAIQIIDEMSVETLSQTKTQAYCGYSFDFTVPGSEQQDESQITQSAHKTLSSSGRALLRPSDIPTASEHADFVYTLRDHSAVYFELQQLVRLLMLFGEWREEEENLIKQRNLGNAKINLKKIKDLFETIVSTLEPLLDSFLDSLDNSPDADAWALKKIYIPEIVLTYISIVQAAAYFTNRDLATKAMEIAVLVADEERDWVQRVFLETGRMTELVGALAEVSKAMLRLNEHETKGKVGSKKRGHRGETLKIWDLNVRN